MGLVKPFSTLTEMFDLVTKEFSSIKRPAFLRKIKKEWIGISYSEYRNLVKYFTMGLQSLGIERNDKVAILSENRIEWIVADMSILASGCITVPIYPSSTSKQIEFILNNSETKYLILSNQLQLNKIKKIKQELSFLKRIIIMNEKVEIEDGINNFSDILEAGKLFDSKNPGTFVKLLYIPKPEDTATIIYTSGTTGEPKGVELTHRNFEFQMTLVAKLYGFSRTDIDLSFLPLCHVFERTGNFTLFSCGATIAFADSIDTVAENMIEIKPTIIITVPRLFERIYSKIIKMIDNGPAAKKKIFFWALKIGRSYIKKRKDGVVPLFLKTSYYLADLLVFKKIRARTGGRIRFFVSGGAALQKEIGEFFETIGIQIAEGYGLTETSPIVSANRLNHYKFGSIGKPFPEVEVKIANDGEILVRGPLLMKGYFNAPEATKEAIDSDGWFHTGDIGHFDSENFLYITDRKKNLFVSSGGKNIAPQPIENLFLSSRFIDQFVLIGDRRQFLSALIVPDMDAIKEYADMNQIEYNEIKDLIANEEIYKVIGKDIEKLQTDLANYERVRKFALLEKPLSLEDGEITPSLKIKRKAVEERYSHIIEDMYKLNKEK